MTKLTLDLAEKLGCGVTIPVRVEVDEFLEYADDDWVHELDLDDLLAERRQVAVRLDAGDVHDRYPHLTLDQAWDVIQIVRTDLEAFGEDATADAVHVHFPTARMRLQTRVLNLRYSLDGRTDEAGQRVRHELAGLERVLHKLPTVPDAGSPALEGTLAVALDELETAAKVEGGVE